MIAGGSVATAMVGRASREAPRAVGFDHDKAATGGRRNEMAEVAEKAQSLEDIQRFETFACGARVLRSCELSLRCVASGIRRRDSFFDITGR